MVVAFSEIELRIPDCNSLKEKRRVVQSILGRLKARTSVSAAEVGGRKSLRRAVVGVAVVASRMAGAQRMMDAAIRLVEAHGGAELVDVWIDYAS